MINKIKLLTIIKNCKKVNNRSSECSKSANISITIPHQQEM